ncbi:MAG: hypothetical protein FWD89_02930 [Firmicutes bacterium]|nr:hypothetical protein [Bacillota bacterium]
MDSLKTIIEKENEYVLNNEFDIAKDRAYCFSEIKTISDKSIRQVSNVFLAGVPKKLNTIILIVMNALSIAGIIYGAINWNTDMFFIFYFGLFFPVLTPGFILLMLFEEKRKARILKEGRIFPGEVLDVRMEEIWTEGAEGGGSWVYFYEIDYLMFAENEDIKGRIKFNSNTGFNAKEKHETYLYYKGKKYLFLLKGKKVYPVRLLKENTIDSQEQIPLL